MIVSRANQLQQQAGLGACAVSIGVEGFWQPPGSHILGSQWQVQGNLGGELQGSRKVRYTAYYIT